jgi:hypothetical protein
MKDHNHERGNWHLHRTDGWFMSINHRLFTRFVGNGGFAIMPDG